MKIFNADDSLTSYLGSFVKILICGTIIVILGNRNNIIQINNIILNLIVSLLCGVVGVLSIICLLMSCLELRETHRNRVKIKALLDGKVSSTEMMVDEVVNMSKWNNLIDFQIVVDDMIFGVGSRTDHKRGTNLFFNKRYYVDKKELKSIDEFRAILLTYAINEKLSVFSINGCHNIRGFKRRSIK